MKPFGKHNKMKSLTIQQSIDLAKQDPTSPFAKQLRNMIETGQLDEPATKQGVDLTQFGRQPVHQNYFERVGQDIKQGFQGAKEDIKSNDGRNALSKGISAVSNIASAVASPITEAPVVKQVGELAGKGIELAGNKLADAYSPEFKDKLSKKSDEEFRKNTQALKDIAGVGNVANTILLAKGAGKVSKSVTKGAGNVASKTGEVVKENTKGVQKVVKDLVPKADNYVNEQVTKALDLTQGDVSNIARSTGNEIGRFLADENLIRSNKLETQNAIKEFYGTKYNLVREEIGKVKKTYKQNQVPRYVEALKEIKKKTDNVAGLQEVSVAVDNLLNNNKISLADVQKVKELMDEHFSLYKVTGDVGESVAKQGLANLRSDLKTFIESEVKKETGADISKLNNQVATAKSLDNAIDIRSTKGLTKSNLQIGDLGFFGLGFGAGGPLGGLALVFAKKIMETPSVRLKIARYVDSMSDARKAKIKAKLEAGEVPPELKKFVD